MMMMTTMTETRLAGPLQALVDSRLDTIERMLMGHLPRQERLAIVREVEAQVFELLQERERPDEEPTREDVLAVLARLDPPEAYMAETGEDNEPAPRQTMPVLRPAQTLRKGPSQDATVSGVLGLAVLALVALNALCLLVAVLGTNEATLLFTSLLGACFLVLVGGAGSIVLAVISRLRGAWTIVGLVTGGFSLLYAVFVVAWLLPMVLG